MIPGVLIRVPVVVVTLLRCGRSVEPLSSTGLGVRLGPAPYDELSVVQEVSRPCDVHGDTEVRRQLLPLPRHRLVVQKVFVPIKVSYQ